MASNLFEGDFVGRAVKPEFGTKNGRPTIRIEMEIAEGDLKGRRATYEGRLDEKNIAFTKRAMLAIGWKGESIVTFVTDVKTANLIVPFRVEIASWQPNDGRSLQQWSAVKSIGGGAKPLDAIDNDKIRDVDRWFAEAGDVSVPANGKNDGIPF